MAIIIKENDENLIDEDLEKYAVSSYRKQPTQTPPISLYDLVLWVQLLLQELVRWCQTRRKTKERNSEGRTKGRGEARWVKADSLPQRHIEEEIEGEEPAKGRYQVEDQRNIQRRVR